MKNDGPENPEFHWQAGYAAFSVSQSNLDEVRRYIENQEEHHRKMTFQESSSILSTTWDRVRRTVCLGLMLSQGNALGILVVPLQGAATLTTRTSSQGVALGWNVFAPSGRDSTVTNASVNCPSSLSSGTSPCLSCSNLSGNS